MSYNTLFGPVPSRRLGISLGIDLIPYKICSFDCVYCEVGKTTRLTTKTSEYIPADVVIQELNDYLNDNPKLDYITFSGSGEPLLNSRIGSIIQYIKQRYPKYRLALLTNSSLIHDETIQKILSEIDLILPSLDAAQEEVFQRINRPHPSLKIQQIINGLIDFRKLSAAQMWLEVFILPGYNDSPEHLQSLKDAIMKIGPDMVQLNTLDRPGTVSDLQPASLEELQRLTDFLKPLKTEIISSSSKNIEVDSFNQDICDTILQTLRRRPCTDDDLCSLLGKHRNELNKYIQILVKKNLIQKDKQKRGDFWRIVH